MKTYHPQQWKESLQKEKNAVILDVRTQEEFDEHHIPGAQLADVQNPQEFISQISAYDKNKNYFVYCGTGRRSNQACQVLEFNGFKNVINLKGGLESWLEANR